MHKYIAKRNIDSTIYLYRAMNKYGSENFDCEILESDISLDNINDREIFWIREINSLMPNGYNLTIGGEGTKGYKMPEETKKKISVIKKEQFKKMSDEEKNQFINRMNHRGGDLDKMNEGFRKWYDEASEEELKSIRTRASKTKKEKGYDFYSFSFGKMTESEKKLMYEKTSKNNPKSIGVMMFSPNGELMNEFHSIREASRFLSENYGVTINSKGVISKSLDKEKLAYGFIWKRK